MRNLKLLAAVMGVILLMTGHLFAARSISDSVAVVSDFAGSAKIYKSGIWKNAAINMPVYEGSWVKAGGDSFIEITFDDATIVRLDSDSEMKISELKRTGSTARTIFNLAKGKLLAVVDKLRNPDSKFEIHTKMAIAAVKGTELFVDANNTVLGVNEGSVAFTLASGGNTFSVDGGYKCGLKNGRLGKPGIWRGRADYTVRFNKIRQEVKIIKELRMQGDDAVLHWRIQKKRTNDGAEVGETETEATLGGTNKYVGKLGKKLRNTLKHKLRKELQNERSHAWRDLKYVNEEMNADFHLGKTAVDHRGYRVRIEEFVFRPEPNQIDLLSVTLRKNKGEERIDYMRHENIFKNPIPENPTWYQWGNLWKKEWVGLAEPENYIQEERFKMSNTDDWLFMGTLYAPQLAVFPAAALNMNKYIVQKHTEILALGTEEPLGLMHTADFINLYENHGFVKEHRIYGQVLNDTGEQQRFRGVFDKTFMTTDQYENVRTFWSDPYNAGNVPDPFAAVYHTVAQTMPSLAAGGALPHVYEEINSLPFGDLALVLEHKRMYNDGTYLTVDIGLIDDYGNIKYWPQTSNLLALAVWSLDTIFNSNAEIIVKSNAFDDQYFGIDVVSRVVWDLALLNPKHDDGNTTPQESTFNDTLDGAAGGVTPY